MANGPHLVWNNPSPLPHFTVTARTLRHLSDAIVSRVKEGQFQAARGLMSLYALSPIAAGFVAERLFRAGVPKDEVMRIL